MPDTRGTHLNSTNSGGLSWTTALLLAFALAITHVAASPTSDAQAYQLVGDMLKAQRSLAYSGEQVTTIYSQGGPISSSEQTVVHDGTRGMRLDYHSPARLAGESRGDNGRVLWHFKIKKREVDQMPSALGRLKQEIRRAEDSIKNRRIVLHVMGEDTVAGRHTVIVQASPVNPGVATEAGARRFWIDPANGAQLRIVVLGPTGNPISDSYFTQITYSPPLTPNAFDPPADAATTNLRAEIPFQTVGHVPPGVVPALGFDVLEPSYLPAGYHFDSGQMFTFKGAPAFGIRYVNGLTVISLYETMNKKPKSHNHFMLHRNGMLTGVLSGIQVVLLGNVDSSDLIRMYQSLH